MQLNQRIRIQGDAYHPAGIFEILVGNARVELQRSGDGTSARFVTFLPLTVPQRTFTIQVRGYAGQPFEAVYPLVYEDDEDLTKYAQPWAAADSVQLLVGTDDTVAIRLAAPPHERVPARHLTWSTSNADVVTVDSGGVVHPVTPGSAAIYVSGFAQNLTFSVRVYDQPSDVTFLPADSLIELVFGQGLRPRATLHYASGQLVRNLVPELIGPDTIVLKRDAPGTFTAIRTGSTIVRAQFGGRTHRWMVRVLPPSIHIVSAYGALLIGQPQTLAAVRRDRKGAVLGPADGVTWQVADSGALSIRGNTALGHRAGRASISAAITTEADTATLFVLGDLLIAAKDERGNDMLATVSLQDRQTHRIGPDSVRGTSLSLAPDGRQIVFSGRVASRSPRIYVMDTDGGNLRRLMPDASGIRSHEEHSPRWTHDGSRVVFVSNRMGNYEIMSVRTDGTDLQRATSNSATDWRVNAAPDVPKIAFERLVGAGDGDIVVSMVDGTGEAIYTLPRPMPDVRISESKPALLRGATALVFARGAPRLDEAAGQTLTLLDLTTGLVTRDLVPAVRDTELVFAVSPDGTRIAYHQRSSGSRRNNVITIIDLSGNVLGSISVGRVREIVEISWGATPPTTREN
ncbi:MAG: hypothetical protein ACRENP_07335 [Longimicrobiales bacterium]